MTATADKSVTSRSDDGPGIQPGITAGGEEHQIDLLLPAAVPSRKLAEPTRDAINQRLRAIAPKNCRGAFVFARAAGMTMLG